MADKTAEQQPAQFANDMSVVASQLSAMVDGELQDIENDLALRRLSRDRDARDRWERYHLISDALQDHLPAMIDTDFAARIRQAIAAEPLPLPGAKPLPTWYKPVTGFALAASVVLMVLFGLKLTQTDIQPTAQLAAATPALPISATALPIQTVASIQRSDPASEPVEARLGSYLVNHNGYASMNSMHGMLPYVRMVGYQTER
ncbi:MAG: sigma-E factor negative regulatory protein [Candidatus Competibacteraceae bacterium]|nr:sigma-E factor negative regulatory protein [Candidatus Competibacteraceae bacterium]